MICELFDQIQDYLSDEENMSLILCSKEIYNQKTLIKFKSFYNLSKIYDRWCLPQIKTIIIDDYIESTVFEDQIKIILFNSTSNLTINNLSINWITNYRTKIKLVFYLCNQTIKLCIKYELFDFATSLLIIEQYYLADKYAYIGAVILKNNALLEAVNLNCFQIVKLLICKDDNVLYKAIVVGLNNPKIDIKIIKLLINSHTYINLYSIITIPISNGNVEILQLLISYGADISLVSKRDIMESWKKGHKDMARFLTKNNFKK